MRLYDHRTGKSEELPRRTLRVHILNGAGYRALIITDVLRRVARRAYITSSPYFTAPTIEWDDYGIQRFTVVDADDPTPDADVYVMPEGASGPTDAHRLAVPHETGDWLSGDLDGLTARLAMLEVRYRERLHLTTETYQKAAKRLDNWRRQVADWANSPGRPLERSYASEAEKALADDLDTPTALAVLDRLTADPDVPPGAKLETFIHLDMMLGLNVVGLIGRV